MAILVMALNALWPLIANARPDGAPGLMEICTAQGIKTLPDGTPAGDPAANQLQPHCPLCSFGTDKLAAVPPSVPDLLPVQASHAAPAAILHGAAIAAPQHSPAHPRAPPVFL